MSAKIHIRKMPKGYPSDCWLVTGAIYRSEVRYYRKLKDAQKYANELIKEFEKEGYYPREIVIEERLFDITSTSNIIE